MSLSADPAALWHQRYGTDLDIALPPWNATLASQLSHRSVRKFLPTPLPEGTLETLIAAAQSASSSSNLQLWSVIAVEASDRKARFAELTGNQKHIVQAPLFLAWIADLARLQALGAGKGVDLQGLDYFEMMLVAAIDTALAAQNAAAAAESLGLGVVYIGAMRNHPEEVARELKLPPHAFAVFGMCVGYPDPAEKAGIKPRLPQKVVLHRETYGEAAPLDGIAEYETALNAYWQSVGITIPGWTDTVIKRTATPQALSGRDRLREALNNLGFALK